VTAAILGGIGLFLLGMVLMTDGLKAAAGDALRGVLGRLTGGVGSAFLSGAGVTALVQSSSATILATIGFVSAGLLTFSQAVGVIVGAAVGTTSTGWLVAFVGLKYSIGAVALPLVGAGALMRLLGRGRVASLGLALAGFGLIFVGIDTLQSGMLTLSDRIDLTGLRGDTAGHRVVLVLVGAAMTVVMQSSSAAVATTLTALHAGTIDLAQAATLVIGQNVGTSVTAALASLGASVPARRTALSHILFNLFSGTVAFVLLPLALPGLEHLARTLGAGPEGATAVFHTAFNVLGAALLLPFVGAYAALVSRLVPDRTPALTRNLDDSVRNLPTVAVEAARRTARDVAALVLEAVRARLPDGVHPHPPPSTAAELAAAGAALGETRRFLGGVRSSPEAGPEYARHLSVLHAIDHVERLVQALQDPVPVRVLLADPDLRAISARLAARLRAPPGEFPAPEGTPPVASLEETSRGIAEMRRAERPRVLERTVVGSLSPDAALVQLDAMRWLDRLAYHAWRAAHHLAMAAPGSAMEEPGAPAPPEP
jgi:phosphate:Na+ symporter